MPRLTIEAIGIAPRELAWRDGSIGIGRHPQNHVCLQGDGVSRWHAAIFARAGGGYHLRDLGSRRGVRVEGRRVVDRLLKPGDRIEVGKVSLIFHLDDSTASTAVVLVEDHDADIARLQAHLPLSEDDRASLLAQAADGSASVRNLLAAIRAVSSGLDIDDMLLVLLDRVNAATSPSECCVARVRDDGTLDIRARRSSPAIAADDPLPLSRTLLRRAVATGQPLFVRDVETDTDLASASVRSLGIVAAACVPIVSGGRVRAMLHADWRRDHAPPRATDFEWIAALSAHAAVTLEACDLHGRLRDERDRLAEDHGLSTELVGMSHALRDLLDIVDRCAGLDVDVLVTGETGTGKELVARRIHERSRRRDRPFVAVNCAAIPSELLESELFGHVRGAFTHAVTSRAGRLEEAEGGTLFLDEIGEMSPAHQAKILRVLEERRFAPVGGALHDLDVRVVAATNRDMSRAAAEGRVREDLRQRLGVPITVPALRERSDDIPMLAYFLLDRLGRAHQRNVQRIAPDAMECLVAHDWPGNVRELAGCLRNALLFCGDVIESSHLRLSPDLLRDREDVLPSLADVEKDHLARVLRATSGNQSRTARVLGVSENTVKAMMERHGLERAEFAG